MRQIPSERKWCKGCDFREGYYCPIYKEGLTYSIPNSEFRRLPQCHKDRPEILTWVQREALKAEGYEACRKDLEEMK
ncbi:MAG: hypothetical protein ABIK28_18180 [Planctomycetota bacterium]